MRTKILKERYPTNTDVDNHHHHRRRRRRRRRHHHHHRRHHHPRHHHLGKFAEQSTRKTSDYNKQDTKARVALTAALDS